LSNSVGYCGGLPPAIKGTVNLGFKKCACDLNKAFSGCSKKQRFSYKKSMHKDLD